MTVVRTPRNVKPRSQRHLQKGGLWPSYTVDAFISRSPVAAHAHPRPTRHTPTSFDIARASSHVALVYLLHVAHDSGHRGGSCSTCRQQSNRATSLLLYYACRSHPVLSIVHRRRPVAPMPMGTIHALRLASACFLQSPHHAHACVDSLVVVCRIHSSRSLSILP